MARGINKVIIIGNLGADPEVRNTASGNAVTNLSVATDESYKDRQTGQLVPRTEWHRIVMFGKLAEIAGQYLKKGSKVYLEGRLQTRKWQDQSGQDRYTTEVVVDMGGTMQMLDSGPGGNGQAEGATHGNYQQQSAPARNNSAPPMNAYKAASEGTIPTAPTPPHDDPFDDDIPFG